MESDAELDALINRLVLATDPAEVKALYAQWSKRYDQDLTAFGYVAPEQTLQRFMGRVPDPDARIYDAGCGTGRMGLLLARHGYTEVHGGDFSDAMRQLAHHTGAYQSLAYADYSKAPDASGSTPHDAPNQFDGIVSVGVYQDAFRKHFLSGMLHRLKPGGSLVFSCRPVHFDGDDTRMPSLNAQLEKWAQANPDGELAIETGPYMVKQQADAYYISLSKPDA